jgi:sn-glycerol 3-phosphate transport system permease protein
MVEEEGIRRYVAHVILWIGIAIVAFPVYLAFIASTQDNAVIANGQMSLLPGGHFLETYYQTIFVGSSGSTREPVGSMMFNSLIMSLLIAIGKIAISIISAYAVVYFRFPFRMTIFWLIFITLMLPVEVRIYPTYKIVADLHLLDSYAGFWDTLLPLSRTNMAALFVILFILGWNQYLWPLLITTRDDMQTIQIGIRKMITTTDALTEWPIVMATAVLAMLPPVFVVVVMQKLFVRGLVETEK